MQFNMILKITFFHVHERVGRIFPYRLAILQSIIIMLQNLSQRGFPTAFTKVKNVDIRSEKGVNEDLRFTSQHEKIMYFHRAVSKVYQTWPFMSSFLQMGHSVPFELLNWEREIVSLILCYSICKITLWIFMTFSCVCLLLSVLSPNLGLFRSVPWKWCLEKSGLNLRFNKIQVYICKSNV